MAEKNKNNNSLVFADNGYLSYIDFSKLSFADKLRRRLNIAKAQFDNGSLVKAGYALVGGYDPENPRLSTGDVPNPGMRNPAEIVNNALLSIKLMETINNYWKNLGRLKIRLGGNGKYASGILTKPGTAPTTFNGLNISYITSPKGGNVTHKFYTDLGSEYILTKDGFARRIKSSHANTGGADSGLHEWNKGATRFLDSDELGWSYQAWTDRTKPLGFSEKDGIISLVTKDNGKWRYVMRSELRPNAVKNKTIKDGIIQSAYTTEPKVGKWILEYGTNPTGEINWFHPGSQVAFIEGLKQGGQIRKMLTASGGPIKKPIKRLKDGYRYIPDEENGGWDRISDNAMSDVFATMEFTPKKTNVGSSITRKQSTPSKTYYSAYNPDDVIKGFNALTLGGLNNLSPTQWARRVYDTGKLLSGDMTWSGYTDSWINGNNGLVSLKFSEEHPYLSTGINLVGDAAVLGGISGAKKLTNISKPNINVAADIGTSVEQKVPALSLEEIEKAFNQARQWHLNRINSPGYKDRALRAGFTEEEIPQLLQLLTRLINSLKLQNKEKLFPNNFSYEDNFGKINAEYWRLPTNKGMFLGIGFYNPNMSYDEAVSKFIHEFGHGATFGLNGNETTGLAGKLSKQFPLITKAVLYNKSLFPEVTEETVKKVFPYAAENGKLEYYSRPTELLARGYEFMRDYANNWWKLKNSGNSFTNLDAMNNAANSRLNSKLFRGLTGNSGAYNFQKNALGISVPLGLGGYGLYNNDNYLQQLQYLKQGGKMNILEFLKNGSGIHIKKKNRGKFTSYCGGKVTDECILKGKNSSNPAIRKRATFADNAKHFKHKEGGIIKASDGTKTSWISNSLGKVGNFLNSDFGKLALNGISSSIFGGNSEPSYNVLNNYSDTMTDTAMQYILQLLQQALALSDLDSTLKSLYDPLNPHSIDGDIVGRHYKWMALAPQQAQLKNLQKQLKELIDALNKLQKTNYITNALTNTLLTGLDLALNYKPTTKKGSSVS